MENRNQVMAVVPFSEIEKMAVAFAKSNLFGIKTPDQAIALMLIAQAEGLHPAIAARDYHIVQGRPALKADAMLARFHAAGGKVVWNSYTDSEVSATFSHAQGGSATVTWTIAQAKAAGLTGKDVWKQYPRAMLRARVISEAIRTVFPGVAVGVYTPEEVEDFAVKPTIKEVKAEVSAPVEPSPAPVTEAPRIAKPKAPTVEADTERKALIDKIKTSPWTQAEKANYAKTAWGVMSAGELATEHLRTMAAVVTGSSYDTAMAEQAELTFGSQDASL